MARRPDRGRGRRRRGGTTRRSTSTVVYAIRRTQAAAVRDLLEAASVSAAQYRCGDERRRRTVRDATPPTLNGIDFLEVGPDQTTLDVSLRAHRSRPGRTTARRAGECRAVDGGVRITGIRVDDASRAAAIRADRHRRRGSGDFSTLRASGLVDLTDRRRRAFDRAALGRRRSRSRSTARATSTAPAHAARPSS